MTSHRPLPRGVGRKATRTHFARHSQPRSTQGATVRSHSPKTTHRNRDHKGAETNFVRGRQRALPPTQFTQDHAA